MQRSTNRERIRLLAVVMGLAWMVAHVAPARGAQELRCGIATGGNLISAEQVDSYTLSLAATHSVSLGVSSTGNNLLRLRLEKGGEVLANTCDGFVNLFLERGDYELDVQDCRGGHLGGYRLLYNAQPSDYRPQAIAVSPQGSEAYVANSAGTISVIDLSTATVTREIRNHSGLGQLGAAAMVLIDDGAIAYVADALRNMSTSDIDAINRVDLVGGRVTAQFLSDSQYSARHFIVTRDGLRGYLTGRHPVYRGVRVVDLLNDSPVTWIDTGAVPDGLALSPDQGTIYVTSSDGNVVDVIDVMSDSHVGRIAVGGGPIDVAFTPDGRTALVIGRDEQVSFIDTESRSVRDEVAIANRACPTGTTYAPRKIAVAPSGDTAIVVNQGCYSVSILDLEGDAPRLRKLLFFVGPTGLGNGPYDVGYSPDGRRAYVTNRLSDNVAEIDVATGAVTQFIDLTPGQSSCSIQRPMNDHCATARSIDTGSRGPGEFKDVVDASYATTDANDPVPACTDPNFPPRSHSVWYRFDAPSDGILSVDTFESTYHTVLTAYAGDCDTYLPLPHGCSAYNGQRPTSLLALPVEAGSRYFFMVSSSDSGVLALTATFSAIGGPLPTPSPTAVTRLCSGDCNGNRVVTVDELLSGVAIALGEGPLSGCQAADRDQNGVVTVDDVIGALTAALSGCSD